METKADYHIAREELQALWAEHVRNKNLQVDITAPIPHVDGDWPCMKYYISVGSESFEYKMGIGHAKMERLRGKETDPSTERLFKLYENESRVLKHLNMGHDIKDKRLCAEIACKVGRNVKPDSAEVIAAVCSDYESANQAGDFENWCSEFGYDTDSRKAEDTYRKRIEFHGKLKRIGLNREQITKFAELHAQL